MIYWEGADRRILQGDPIPAGEEHTLTTFPGHKFTYDFGGERHWVEIRADRDVEVLEMPQGEGSAEPNPDSAAAPSSTLDPYAMPLPVALGLQALCSGLIWYWRLTGSKKKAKMTPQQEQLFHGLWMFVVSLLAGLLIPHVPRPRSMLSFHGVGCLQAAVLLAFAAVWPQVYPDGGGAAAAWCNILGKWGNCVGFTYSSLSGAQCLLYWTKRGIPAVHAVGSAAETVLEVTLKLQGTLDVVGVMMMAHAYLKLKRSSKKEE